MKPVKGYFTVERNIVGLSLREMETTLGFRPGRLARGARILVLVRPPNPGEFVFAGSTRYPNADGLVDLAQRRNVPVPHAWLGQRLVKVDPIIAHTDEEQYPRAHTPVEQWELVAPVYAEVICSLGPRDTYWRRR
jgi:hypothetical protein